MISMKNHAVFSTVQALVPTVSILLALFGFLLTATPLRAQSADASLRGTVADQTGAVIVGARVILRADSGIEHVAASDNQGRFAFEKLQPGDYTFTVEKAGFLPTRPSRVTVGAETPEFNPVLEPSPVSDIVTVTGSGAALESTFKLPGSLHETPRSVTVIDSERIREQNFRFVNDTFAYVPGFAVNSYRTGGYHFYARGYRMLPDDTRVDGSAGINAGGRYGATLFGVEQVVLLRGPAGLLYGSAGSPGGLVNLISKKPLDSFSTRIDLRTGGYAGNGVGLGERGFGGLDLDTTGPLARNGRVLYRVLFTIENMNYFTNRVLDRNRYGQVSFTFKLDDAGRYTLTPIYQWTRFNRPAGGGIVVSPSTSLSTNDKIDGPINTADLSSPNVNLSSGGGIDETHQAGFGFKAEPLPTVRINGSFRHIRYDTSIDQFAPQVTTAAQINDLVTKKTVQRVQSKSEATREYNNFDLNAVYEFKPSGWWKNMIQAGGYTRLARTRTTTPNGPAPSAQSPINIYTGATTTPLVSNHPALRWGNFADTTFWNAYVQNRTSLDNGRWVVTFGLLYGQNHVGGQSVRKSDVMPNAALLFNATTRLAVYASYATSFNPTDPDAEDITGRKNVFKPTTGTNFEVGAKYDLPSRKASWAVSWFHNRINNALVQSGPNDFNPNGNRYFAEGGNRRSRGVEAIAEVQALPDLRITGAVSWLDAIYEGGGPASSASTTAIPGSRAEKSPRWSYNVRARYDRSEGKLRGFGAALGLIWQGERLGGNGARTPAAPDPLVLPSFTRVDASLSYRLNQNVDFALNFENLFDKLIFVSGTVGSSLEIAAPRTVSFRMGYRF